MSSRFEWDMYYMNIARVASEKSKDPSTKTGAVLVSPENVQIASGYNGFPRRIKDDHRLNDRETKYKIVIHCEMNAVLFARRDITGSTLYTYPFMSCSRCASHMIQAGVVRVVSFFSDNERWKDDFDFSTKLFQEAGVLITLYDNPHK